MAPGMMWNNTLHKAGSQYITLPYHEAWGFFEFLSDNFEAVYVWSWHYL